MLLMLKHIFGTIFASSNFEEIKPEADYMLNYCSRFSLSKKKCLKLFAEDLKIVKEEMNEKHKNKYINFAPME
jgi:hypothetical protein